MIRATPDLIARFSSHYVGQRRLGMVIGVAVWTGFHLWDIQLFGRIADFEHLRLVRLGIGAPLIALLAGLSYQPSIRHDWQHSLLGSAAISVAWCCLLVMMAIVQVPYAFDQYVAGLMTVLLFHFTMFKHRWLPALFTALMLCALFNVAVYLMWQGELEQEEVARWFSANSYFLTIVVLGALLCYEMEQTFYLTVQQRDELVDQNRKLQIAQEQEQVARAKAESSYQERTAFLLQASHDLRQPMQSIEIYVDLLKRGSLSAAETGTVAKLGQAVRSMDHLFRGLLDLNRLDSGAIQPRLAPCYLPAVVEEVTTTCAPLAAAKNLDLRVRCGASVWVNSDPVLLARILRNLLVNAIAYTQRGGVLVTLRRRGGCALIQVLDTGEGIDPAYMEDVFKPFVRLNTDGTHARRGLGLGLAIVRGMADKLGAEVQLRSRVGRGSTFGLSLPLLRQIAVASVPPSGAGRADEERQATPLLGSAWVALVENDPEILEAAAAFIRTAGFQVVFASNGRALLELIAARGVRPQVLVADVELGAGEDAWSVMQAVSGALGAALPMVLMTGSVRPEYGQRAQQAGQIILQKPFPPQALVQAIRTTINGAAAAQG